MAFKLLLETSKNVKNKDRPLEDILFIPKRRRGRFIFVVPTILTLLVGVYLLYSYVLKDLVTNNNTYNSNAGVGLVEKKQENFHIRGSQKALISAYVFMDYDDPYTRTFHNTTMTLLNENFNRVNIIYRHLPNKSLHPLAFYIAETSECVGNSIGSEAFWSFTDSILTTMPYPKTEVDVINKAVAVGMSREELVSCINAHTYKAQIDADIKEANKLAILGTPWTILINNQTGETKSVRGAQPYEDVKNYINELL